MHEESSGEAEERIEQLLKLKQEHVDSIKDLEERLGEAEGEFENVK